MRFVSMLVLLSACASAPESATTSPRSDYLVVAGDSIYYEVAGAGPAVVLIHGAFGDRRMWDPQFGVLARDFRVVRYDHRGFGKSSIPDTAYSAMNDVLRLLDHLSIGKAHIVGNSLGGGTALDFAVAHPERVNKVVVVASGANGYPYTDDDVASIAAVFRAAEQQGADQAAEMWLRDPMIKVASRRAGSAALVQRMVRENRDIFLMRDWPWERLTPSAYERLGAVKLPVLFVIGDQDSPTTQKVAAATSARLPQAEVFRMVGADHLPQLVDPDAFNARLIEFLRR